ncbi:MAG: hypothetical protein JXR62_01815, partial [Bacilli bacterium]|nr:hypothetical protein [Bacilli bacterium]
MSQFMHHNLQREYVLYQPSNVKKGCPLVVFLHWYTGSSEDVINFIGFNEIADKYGFAVVYPEGTLDKYQTKHWNANLDLSDTDDIG